ncbi:hypothetical protein [Phytoactinopolyspora halotolerans]|uniref:Uncharacterized protein n=1 Tax=Phytoactinopolyspora halotolerans TaxID=1981512 RepID=A0A6L9S9G8_9ACTN|nr:hypothetical protein [Phytoactinopolyspora halotolerans]NEE00600.1 hypothetical protein [Phytoactinopolyspora halotolerans]
MMLRRQLIADLSTGALAVAGAVSFGLSVWLLVLFLAVASTMTATFVLHDHPDG